MHAVNWFICVCVCVFEQHKKPVGMILFDQYRNIFFFSLLIDVKWRIQFFLFNIAHDLFKKFTQFEENVWHWNEMKSNDVNNKSFKWLLLSHEALYLCLFVSLSPVFFFFLSMKVELNLDFQSNDTLAKQTQEASNHTRKQQTPDRIYANGFVLKHEIATWSVSSHFISWNIFDVEIWRTQLPMPVRHHLYNTIHK